MHEHESNQPRYCAIWNTYDEEEVQSQSTHHWVNDSQVDASAVTIHCKLLLHHESGEIGQIGQAEGTFNLTQDNCGNSRVSICQSRFVLLNLGPSLGPSWAVLISLVLLYRLSLVDCKEGTGVPRSSHITVAGRSDCGRVSMFPSLGCRSLTQTQGCKQLPHLTSSWLEAALMCLTSNWPIHMLDPTVVLSPLDSPSSIVDFHGRFVVSLSCQSTSLRFARILSSSTQPLRTSISIWTRQSLTKPDKLAHSVFWTWRQRSPSLCNTSTWLSQP